MNSNEIFQSTINGELDKLTQKICAITDVTQIKNNIEEALVTLEKYLKTNKFPSKDKEHNLIQYIAYLCSLSPYHEKTSKMY